MSPKQPSTVRRSLVEPRDADVLCGKTSTNKHPGNVFFRELVLTKVTLYMRSSKKAQKGLIVAFIVKELNKLGTRFLKLDKDTDQWRIISPGDAREKVSHAIRDRVRERKKGKIIEPDYPILSMPPSAMTTTKMGKRKVSKKRKIYKRKAPTQTTIEVPMPASLITPPTFHKKIKVVQGGEDLIILNATIQNQAPIVSEDDGDSSSTDGCAMTFAPELSSSNIIPESVRCPPPPSPSSAEFSSSNLCKDSHTEDGNIHHNNYIHNHEYYAPLVEDSGMDSIVPYLDPCDVLLQNNSDDTPFNELWSDAGASEDENSTYLDDYNDLLLLDIPNRQDDSDFVVSMLQEACDLMLDF
mmetsp:Transcript_21960/g.36338  ORF Transcript_21960/g.36338 Transcript_21960/m.36338 type:complete len:354 (-) Transcript_21960:202-1263(-)|eukprot:CAMPEP_0119007000 /NCGR_PEP_ID=MMETSP1176-20130426/2694_1 /TAXON_ID=265551 /ORGANISM="Synedropsis recta cf, Strain CCMP1620" /LENGTH=353 /DNA_ID=CAMNT_0006959049 /DNA_START=111 /DNA_END=1172 /DNA_ORIENTATION=+